MFNKVYKPLVSPYIMENHSVSDVRHFALDGWQKSVMSHEGNIALRCSRQSGKSTAVALKARKLAYDYPDTTILIMSPSLRQSSLLYEKVRAMLELDNADIIKAKLGEQTFTSVLKKNEAYRGAGIFQDKEPTKHRIRLKNGSQILTEACGETGAKIRGYTVDFLIVDEAQEIPNAVWVAVIPMLATSKKMRGTGWVIILGTPKGKIGYYYECFGNKDYKHIHVQANKCNRITKKFLTKEKHRLTKIEYDQEYNALFVASIRQYFDSKLVDDCVVEDIGKPEGKIFLGVDFARYGGDENAYCEAVLDGKTKSVSVVWAMTEDGGNTTTTMGFIKNKDDAKNYNRIFIDPGGLGGTILDVLQETISNGRRKVIGLDNSHKRFQEEGEEKKAGIFKEDLYMNVKVLMEQGKLKIIKDPKLIMGLKAVSFEYSKDTGKVRIKGKGKGAHVVEAFVRACWCVKNQALDIYVFC